MPNLVLKGHEPAGIDLILLTFDRALEGHVSAGQFVTAHLEQHKPAYFALANTPGKPVQLLVKTVGDTAEALTALPTGSEIEISAPIGKGFPLPADDTRPLTILATGSGISAVRPVIEGELAAGLPRPVRLLYGVFTLAHRSFLDDLARWSTEGVDVQLVLSEPAPDWAGLSGFVQQAAREAGHVHADHTVVLCGYPGMVEDAKSIWTAAGASPEQLLTNF